MRTLLLRARNSGRWLLVFILWGSLAGSTLEAQFGLITREEALASAFPDASVADERIFLTDEQAERIEAISRVDLSGKLFARYVVSRNGMVVGRSYIDTHQVRTKKESLLVSLDASGRVQRIDVTVFLEPPEFIAGPSWMRQFYDKPLDRDLAIQRAIRPIAGATLTAYAVSESVRRVMAMDQVLTADMETTP